MKKVITTLIVFNLLIGPNLAFAKNFIDVSKDHPNYLATKYLSAKAIINGYADDSFKPAAEINRAELLKILLEAANIQIKASETNCFSDAPYTSWYSHYLCTAKELGIVNGYADGSFKAWQPVNKVEAIKMLAKTNNWQLETLIEQPFWDTPIEAWYTPYIYAAKLKNLLPETDNYFKPAENMNRGNIAETIYRSLTIAELEEEKFNENLLPKIKDLINTIEQNTKIKKNPIINNEEQKIKLAEGDITIVLSWNKELKNQANKTLVNKSNFESHLIKPDGEEIYFSHTFDTKLNIIMEKEENSEKIIIRDLEEGNYEYFIYQYSGNKNFNEAGVKIEIYDSKGLAALYVPSNANSLIWKIFDLNQAREISEANTFGYCEILKNYTALCPELIIE